MTEFGAFLAIAVAVDVAEASPLVVAATRRHPLGGARGWVLAWCALGLVIDALSLWLALHKAHNLWLVYPLFPVTVAMVLWGLSCWQRSDLERLTLRLAIALLTVAWVILTRLVEDTSSFSRAALPMGCLVGLAAAAYTLVGLSLRARGDLLRQDWFWVSAGIALYYASLAGVEPLAALLLGRSTTLVFRAYEIRNALEIVAFASIARGMALAPAV